MKILFFHPERYLNIGIPSGIATLGALAKQHGHEVEVFDTTLIKPKSYTASHVISEKDVERNVSAGDETAPIVKGQIGIFKQTAVTLEDLVVDDEAVDYSEALQRTIDRFSPDLIAISAMTTTFQFACDLIQTVKHNAKVIVGGVHPTIAPDDCIAQPGIDIACIGEADRTFVELINRMAEGKDYTTVKSMWVKLADGTVRKNELDPRFFDLDDLPTPDWSIFDERHLFRPYDGQIYKGSLYSQSRGCPMRCAYCVDPTIAEITGGRSGYFRVQSPQTTYKQLKELYDLHGATWFKFVDDTFLLPKIEHLEELRDLIKPLNIMFGCSVMPNTIRPEKVALAREMGCVAMSIGVESGDPEIRKSVMRRYKNEELIERLKTVKDHGIRISTFNMIGFPGETREQAFRTIELNRNLGADACNVYILYPYPGSPIAISHNIPLRDADGRIPEATESGKLGLSTMGEEELEGIRQTFNAYLYAPKTLWPVVKLAERDTDPGHATLAMVKQFIVEMLSGSEILSTPITDHVTDLDAVSCEQPDLEIPLVFSPIFGLGYDQETTAIIVNAFLRYARGDDALIEQNASEIKNPEIIDQPPFAGDLRSFM
ncbi:MAG: B12-binding domain-containing radical SAM protein [Rhodospirillaceae bacterium]|jgi:anaerobic magnesium-protoporphyrin IX monomethyl ester cyclase|nr:B12-binding domain-containing radical SAM protein [Rhodospirillaceae bacterium]MBT3926800.1 B12-binding domain-containing radical SAM protein [Rhodospirillaceae bacterium]MBT4425874.1 B12-binding domain-containing radical SAM protein [Rhodospirillaceae bacterium]MBT5039702.1 B12-binding domain-containing radical SAM protein [Rhodospirillaceae bacterium]MBT5674890.1 B12-binding domain-containing radical SAM protein [Rhodospirillaceae bacterium]